MSTPSPTNELHDRIALVTGASRGIGRAIALALAREGASVALGFRREEAHANETKRAIEALGRRALSVGADVSRSEDVARMVATVEQSLGEVDVLVNNAGVAAPRELDELTEEDWNASIALNLTSVFLVTQAVLPGMRRRQWGRIINVSSTAAQIGGIVGPHYAAAKAGVLGLTHGYASRLAREGITVNAIAPALVETDMLSGNRRARPELVPMGRFGTVDEVARAAVMLACNAYVTGQTLNVNGGIYMS